jgi:hypothetical protein
MTGVGSEPAVKVLYQVDDPQLIKARWRDYKTLKYKFRTLLG